MEEDDWNDYGGKKNIYMVLFGLLRKRKERKKEKVKELFEFFNVKENWIFSIYYLVCVWKWDAYVENELWMKDFLEWYGSVGRVWVER